MKILAISLVISFLCSSCMLKQPIKIREKYLKEADSIGKQSVDSLGFGVDHIFFKENRNIYTVNIAYYSPKKVLYIKGYLLEKNYACNFSFLPKGELYEFNFILGDNIHYSYKILLDKERYYEEGSPLVDYWPSKNYITSDTLESAEIHFSYFPRKNIDVQYSIDGINYQPFVIEKCNLLPFIMKGEIFKPKKNQPIYFITEASNPILDLTGLIPTRRFYDTLRLQSD
jgi:hypothetical protein